MTRTLLVIFLFATSYAFACSCALDNDPPSIAVPRALEQADAVFLGEVVKTGFFQDPLSLSYGDITVPYQIGVFKIMEAFKGVDSEYFITVTYVECCACGMYLQSSEVYLIYTYGDLESGYAVSTCSRSHRLNENLQSEDLDVLRSLPLN